MARALAEAGININFFVAQSLGDSYTGLFSFEASAEADLAVKIIRKAVGAVGKPSPARKTASRRSSGSPAATRKKAAASAR